MLDDQKLIFHASPFIRHNSKPQTADQQRFAREGYCLIEKIRDKNQCLEYLADFVSTLSLSASPHFEVFKNKFQLGKYNRIPSRFCQDAVQTDFLALHHEMGLPFASTEQKNTLYLVLALWAPPDSQISPTVTRLLHVSHFLAAKNNILESIHSYAKKYGEGDPNYNSGRLSATARLLDAFYKPFELTHMIDERISEWMQPRPGPEFEKEFFAKRGINLKDFEVNIQLKAGQLLIIDNTLVAHGRRGYRRAEEIFQFHYGVENAGLKELQKFNQKWEKRVRGQL